MKEHTKQFLEEFADLLERYNVDIEIVEEERPYGIYNPIGLEFSVRESPDNSGEYILIRGNWFIASDIREVVSDE